MVPGKLGNRPRRDPVEGRGSRAMELIGGKMAERFSSGSISTRLYQIAEVARRSPETVLTTLAHHIDLAWMHEAYRLTRKDGAKGIDGVTAEEYEKDLGRNLEDLLNRFKGGSYRAPAVRRVHIPKGEGKTRLIGIPTFEDKVLQRAVAMVLEAVYEQDFLGCSYGFRPGRSPHQALDVLWKGLMDMGGGWVVDVDISKFFDTLDHRHLGDFLDRRVRDGVIRRAIGKWLNAGVMEEGRVTYPEAGTPQGGVISPILANVYLHEVLDTWFERDVKPVMRGECFMVRFADDVVMVFHDEHDARRVLKALPQRLDRFGLTMHPEKTRLVRFKRPAWRPTGGKGVGTDDRPGTFDFLGFSHHWGLSRKGRWVVKQRTAKGRLKRAIATIGDWCRRHRHWAVAVQHRVLSAKVRGHCNYYGLTGNSWSLDQFRTEVERIWRKWLDRRSQRGHMTWERFHRLKQRYPLPPAIAVHSLCRPAAKP
jgi:RNA-directed DNA polymerase